MTSDPGLVGVFDSGIGGLTVVSAIRRRRPDLRILYVADQAHVPYGDRSLDEVGQFARGISRFLVGQGCGSVVMACNLSSSVALEAVASEHADRPVLGVVAGGARLAVESLSSRSNSIGVLATRGTVASGAYEAAIHALRPDAVVHQVACPDLVPMIEAGEEETPRMLARCMEYMEPLADAGCGVVILGCTHYPLGLSALRVAAMRLFDEEPVFVDPAAAAAEALALELDKALAAKADVQSEDPPEMQPTRLLTTGPTGAFRRQVRRLLPDLADHVRPARWSADGQLEEVPFVPDGPGRRRVKSASSGLQRSRNGQPEVPRPRET